MTTTTMPSRHKHQLQICIKLIVFGLLVTSVLAYLQRNGSWNRRTGMLKPPLPVVDTTIRTEYPPISTKHPAPVDELWTLISNSSHARRVAHYDNRTDSWGGPVLIALTFHDTRINPSPKRQYFAKVVYQNRTVSCLSAPSRWQEIRVPRNEDEKVLLGILLIFNLSTQEVPETMFISETSNCSNPSAYITVFYERPAEPKLNFTVCLYQAMSNLNNHEAFAAWIEMNRQLGAQKIYVYFQTEPERVKEVAQKYVDEGLVEAFDWNSNFTSMEDNCYGQAVLSVDCHYPQTKYLLLYDMDELIIPRQKLTWNGLMKQIDRHDEISGFRFCVSYMHETMSTMPVDSLMDLKMAGCSNVTDIPIMFKRLRRTARVRCSSKHWKNIIKPLGVKYVGTHKLTFADGYKLESIRSKVGLLYHYRSKIPQGRKNEEVITDLTVQKYIHENCVYQALAEILQTSHS